MSNPLPSMPPARPVAIPVDAPSSTWDRISSWVSENKAVVYTIAGVAVVVTGAGVVYYLNSDSVRVPCSILRAMGFWCCAPASPDLLLSHRLGSNINCGSPNQCNRQS